MVDNGLESETTFLVQNSGTNKPRPSPVDSTTPSEELFALIGYNAPPLVYVPKRQPGNRKQGCESWKWTAFTNPARDKPRLGFSSGNDVNARKKLKLHHWAKGQEDGAPCDRFIKLNSKTPVYTYTEDEYEKHLQDAEWTREETDHLIRLALEYDLRFVVMFDRWDLPTNKSIDDMKARYYAICRALVSIRPSIDDATKQRMLLDLAFDKDLEIERKEYVKGLISRTQEQREEEDFLYIETRKLEQSYNKTSTDRFELLKLTGGREGLVPRPAVNLGPAASPKSSVGTANIDRSRRRTQPGWEIEGLDGGGLPEGWAGEGSIRKATPQQDIENCVERHPVPSQAAPKAALYPSVGLRSSRIPQPKSNSITRVQAAMADLGISTHLIMPSKKNVEKLDELQACLGQLVDLRRAYERLEAEIRTVKKKKELKTGIVDDSI